jgi:hypothetical protein
MDAKDKRLKKQAQAQKTDSSGDSLVTFKPRRVVGVTYRRSTLKSRQNAGKGHCRGAKLRRELTKSKGRFMLVECPATLLANGHPHISGSLENVTVSQALDQILKSFRGIWVYESSRCFSPANGMSRCSRRSGNGSNVPLCTCFAASLWAKRRGRRFQNGFRHGVTALIPLPCSPPSVKKLQPL